MRMLILLMALTVCQLTSQADQSSDDRLERTANAGDVLSDIESDSLRDEADPIFLGFSCPKGHSSVPVVYCLPCDYGTYMDNKSFNVCKKCPPDSTTLRKGAESREECVPFCPPGYEMSKCNKTCTKCRPGTFKSSWEKSTPCSKCPVGSHPPKDATGLTDESQCHVGDCIMSCKLWPKESLICRYNVKPYIRCLDNCPADQYQKDFLLRSFSKLHPDLRSLLMPKLNNNETWTQIYDWYKEVCPGTLFDTIKFICIKSHIIHHGVTFIFMTPALPNCDSSLARQLLLAVKNLRLYFLLDSSTINRKCKSSSLIIPHPSECQVYYNCSIPFRGHQSYLLRSLEERMVECPYPQLFNTETERCEEFDKVDCGNRTEIADACKYRETQCYWSMCIPCEARFHSCIDKPDGANVHPNIDYTVATSSKFIICNKERYISSKECPRNSNGNGQGFHPTLRTCKPLPKYGGSFTNECAGLTDGSYLDFSGRCDQFRVCKDANATTVKCNAGEVYDTVRKLCWPYKSACGFCSRSKNW